MEDKKKKKYRKAMTASERRMEKLLREAGSSMSAVKKSEQK